MRKRLRGWDFVIRDYNQELNKLAEMLMDRFLRGSTNVSL